MDGEDCKSDYNTYQRLTRDKTSFEVTFSEFVVILPYHSECAGKSTSFEKFGIRVDPSTMCLTHVSAKAKMAGARVGQRIAKIKIAQSSYYTKYYHDTIHDRYLMLERQVASQAVNQRHSHIGIVLESYVVFECKHNFDENLNTNARTQAHRRTLDSTLQYEKFFEQKFSNLGVLRNDGTSSEHGRNNSLWSLGSSREFARFTRHFKSISSETKIFSVHDRYA